MRPRSRFAGLWRSRWRVPSSGLPRGADFAVSLIHEARAGALRCPSIADSAALVRPRLAASDRQDLLSRLSRSDGVALGVLLISGLHSWRDSTEAKPPAGR